MLFGVFMHFNHPRVRLVEPFQVYPGTPQRMYPGTYSGGLLGYTLRGCLCTYSGATRVCTLGILGYTLGVPILWGYPGTYSERCPGIYSGGTRVHAASISSGGTRVHTLGGYPGIYSGGTRVRTKTSRFSTRVPQSMYPYQVLYKPLKLIYEVRFKYRSIIIT